MGLILALTGVGQWVKQDCERAAQCAESEQHCSGEGNLLFMQL